MGVNSLPKTVTRQRRGCDLNPDLSAPESSTLTTRLPSRVVSWQNYSQHLSEKILFSGFLFHQVVHKHRFIAYFPGNTSTKNWFMYVKVIASQVREHFRDEV